MQPRLFGFFLVLTMISSALAVVFSPNGVYASENTPEFFVGVDIAYGGVDEVKQLADEVSSFTNLFVLGCTSVTQNRLKLDESCQYLFDRGLFFIVYQEYPVDFSWLSMAKSDWVETARERWGNHFLGIYYTDEVGGRQLDHVSNWMVVKNAESYADAHSQFETRVNNTVNWFRNGYSGGKDVTLFTSDYGLYWFDYQAGYNVLLAQFGWNYSRQLNVGLCRGAATAQNKEWGAMITWTYRQTPYIESGKELYNDLLLAYNNGAKYVVIFNSNKEYTGGILEQEHLDALKQFWQYSQQNSRKTSPINDRTAYVLPKNYAYGFRGPNDKIWGLWEADALSTPISSNLSVALQQYDSKLDIIYEDKVGPDSTLNYSSMVYWNSSIPISPVISSENPINGFSNHDLPTILLAGSAVLVVAIGSIILVKRKIPKNK